MNIFHKKLIQAISLCSLFLLSGCLVKGKIDVHLFSKNMSTVKNLTNILPCTNGTVHSIDFFKDQYLVLGGNFSEVAPCSGNGVAFNLETGEPIDPIQHLHSKVNGTVSAVVSDRENGWYIGGSFTSIGSSQVNRIARIHRDGTVNPSFNADFNGLVSEILLDGNFLFVSGNFTVVNGREVSGLVKLNSSTGELVESFTPGIPGNKIVEIEKTGDNLIIGGSFTYVNKSNATSSAAAWNIASGNRSLLSYPNITGEINRVISDGSGGWILAGKMTVAGTTKISRLCHILYNGTLSMYNPVVDGEINAIARKGDTLYVGGIFNNVNGLPRKNLAAINFLNGNVLDFQFDTSAAVHDLEVNNEILYIAGSFISINSVARQRLAAIDLQTNLITSWDPSASSSVYRIKINSGLAYIGGSFTTVGGSIRNRLASVDLNLGAVTSWDPNASGTVFDFDFVGTSVLIGGGFTTVGGAARARIASISLASGLAESWNPGATSTVYSLKKVGDVVYVGGDFSSIGGALRNNFAEISYSSGLATSWDVNAEGKINSIAYEGDTLYVAGLMNGVGGVKREKLSMLNKFTGAASAWNPIVSGSLSTIEVYNDLIFIGGSFTSIDGQPRSKAASFDVLNNYALTNWNPNITGGSAIVNDLKIYKNILYIGGNFTTVLGTTRNDIASIDLSTNLLTPFHPTLTGFVSASGTQVFSMEFNNDIVYLSGDFLQVDGVSRKSLAAYDLNLNQLLDWNPSPEKIGAKMSLSEDGKSLYVGGLFNVIVNKKLRNNFAILNLSNGEILDLKMDTDSTIKSVKVHNDFAYVGGDFVSIGGVSRNHLAKINLSLGIVESFNPNVNGRVNKIEMAGSSLYFAGNFSLVGADTRNSLAVIDLSNDQLLAWNPGIMGEVLTFLKVNNVLYVGGTFILVEGQGRNRMAAFDLTNFQLTNFNPNFNNYVSALAFKNNFLYVGGDFTTLGGSPQSRFAEIDLATDTATAFAISSSSPLTSFLIDRDYLYIGGESYNILRLYDLNSKSIVKDWNDPGFPSSLSQIGIRDLKKKDNKIIAAGNLMLVGTSDYRYGGLVVVESK